MREGELAPSDGLTAITGETGAGKTILAQAIGLLLGAKGDAGTIGAAAGEAYVEAELDLPEGFLEDEELAALAELAPEDEPGLVLARRVFADGRTRAYAWGRAVAREDLAAAAERLIAMSGQFEQRRLARASYQLDVLDSYCGDEQLRRRREARLAWRELGVARKRYEELTRGAAAEEERLRELTALAEATEGFEPGVGGGTPCRARAASPLHRARGGSTARGRGAGARRRRRRCCAHRGSRALARAARAARAGAGPRGRGAS